MRTWTFLTNHAQVLLCVAESPRITTRDISEIVGITERSAQRILDDLEEGGYLTRHREGRRNRYDIHPDISMRHPQQEGVSVRVLLDVLVGDEGSTSVESLDGSSPERPKDRSGAA